MDGLKRRYWSCYWAGKLLMLQNKTEEALLFLLSYEFDLLDGNVFIQ